MEDLIIAILQGLLEFLLEIFSSVPFDWPFRSKNSLEPEVIWDRCLIGFAVGCGVAAVSLLFFKRTWIPLVSLRIANFIVAPLTSALIAQAIARRRKRRNPLIIPRNHFWQSFWFTLGLVAVRFAYVVRH